MALICSYGQCPLKFGKVNPTATGPSLSRVGRKMTDPPDFEVRVQNVSGKDVRGLKVQAAYFDATEDLTIIPVEWNWTSGIKVNAEKTLLWQNIYHKTASVGWLVVPVKILFEDGSTWEAKTPDSLVGCFGEYWRDKKHARLTALPAELLKPPAEKPATEK
jgi:hypothetical protein